MDNNKYQQGPSNYYLPQPFNQSQQQFPARSQAEPAQQLFRPRNGGNMFMRDNRLPHKAEARNTEYEYEDLLDFQQQGNNFFNYSEMKDPAYALPPAPQMFEPPPFPNFNYLNPQQQYMPQYENFPMDQFMNDTLMKRETFEAPPIQDYFPRPDDSNKFLFQRIVEEENQKRQQQQLYSFTPPPPPSKELQQSSQNMDSMKYNSGNLNFLEDMLKQGQNFNSSSYHQPDPLQQQFSMLFNPQFNMFQKFPPQPPPAQQYYPPQQQYTTQNPPPQFPPNFQQLQSQYPKPYGFYDQPQYFPPPQQMMQQIPPMPQMNPQIPNQLPGNFPQFMQMHPLLKQNPSSMPNLQQQSFSPLQNNQNTQQQPIMRQPQKKEEYQADGKPYLPFFKAPIQQMPEFQNENQNIISNQNLKMLIQDQTKGPFSNQNVLKTDQFLSKFLSPLNLKKIKEGLTKEMINCFSSMNLEELLNFPNRGQITKETPQAMSIQPQIAAQISKKKIGSLTFKERQQKIQKYKQKKINRQWDKKINYDCRKRVADKRERIKGRFVTKVQENVLKEQAKSKSQNEFDGEEESSSRSQIRQAEEGQVGKSQSQIGQQSSGLQQQQIQGIQKQQSSELQQQSSSNGQDQKSFVIQQQKSSGIEQQQSQYQDQSQQNYINSPTNGLEMKIQQQTL